MKKALVFLILSFPAFSFGDVISLKSGGEIEGKVKRYEGNKFVVEMILGGKTAISSGQVQTVKFSEPSSKTVTSENTLTLRKSDGSNYVLKGRIKSYEDNKFTVVSSSGGQTAFSIKQIQSITFAEEGENALRIKTKARSSVKEEMCLSPKVSEAVERKTSSANLKFALGRYVEARALHQEALGLATSGPAKGYVQWNLAKCYHREGKYDEAIYEYRKILEIVGVYPCQKAKSYYQSGLCYENQRKYDEAIAEYKKILELPSKDTCCDSYKSGAQLFIAHCYRNLENWTAAQQAFMDTILKYGERGEIEHMVKAYDQIDMEEVGDINARRTFLRKILSIILPVQRMTAEEKWLIGNMTADFLAKVKSELQMLEEKVSLPARTAVTYKGAKWYNINEYKDVFPEIRVSYSCWKAKEFYFKGKRNFFWESGVKPKLQSIGSVNNLRYFVGAWWTDEEIQKIWDEVYGVKAGKSHEMRLKIYKEQNPTMRVFGELDKNYFGWMFRGKGIVNLKRED